MAAKKPTKKTSTRTLTGPRLLDHAVPGTYFLTGAATEPTNGWELSTTNRFLYYENYFDMAGLMLDDLTLVPTVTSLQDGYPYYLGNTDVVAVYDIICTERLDVDEFINYIITPSGPGMPESTEDWNQVIMCNYRLMTLQTQFTNATLALPATGGSFGSQEPSAARKLWIYRVALLGSSTDPGSPASIVIPATRFIMGAEIVKEDDLPYMMRLKRSYELSTQG